jgi:hypothetical protein
LPGAAPNAIDRAGARWWARCVAGSTGLVGREGELSRLRAVVGGDAWLLLVVGDAGVGKTRLITEGMRRVAVDGGITIWGGCLPTRETLPLLPLADALGEFYRVDGGDLLEAALATTPKYVRAEVERLLPQLGSGAAGPSAGRVGSGTGCSLRSRSCCAVRHGDAASSW